jgi:hypothetical protein
MVHGARSLIKHAHKKEDDSNVWVMALIERRGKNKATVALANKLIRIGWAVVRTGNPTRKTMRYSKEQESVSLLDTTILRKTISK